MLTLKTYRPGFGQPSLSPFCVKAMAMLNLAGLDWQPAYLDDPRATPHGKLPVLVDDGKTIADSDLIRDHLQATRDIDFDTGLGPAERAASRAMIRMAEEHLYFAIVMDRWLDPANWAVVRETYFGAIPALLRRVVTRYLQKQARAGLHWHGVARFAPEERLARIAHDLDAIEDWLADRAFLFGAAPTAADCSIGPMLAAALATPKETALRREIGRRDAVVAYVTRVNDRLLSNLTVDCRQAA